MGNYISKDQRMEKKNEIQRAHFHMGFDKKCKLDISDGEQASPFGFIQTSVLVTFMSILSLRTWSLIEIDGSLPMSMLYYKIVFGGIVIGCY